MSSEDQTSKVPPKAVLTAAAVLFVASAVFAVYSWTKRGVCADMAVSAAVSAVSLVCAVILSERMAAVSRAKKDSEEPIFLVRISKHSEKEHQRPIKGKMPDH